MYVHFCFTLNHISSSSSPGNSHIPVRQIITSLMKEDYYYYFFLSRILRLFFGAFSVSNLFSNLFISTVLYFSANTTTALLSEVVLYSIFFHVIICTGWAEGKSGCTASLNVDANTEINGHRKKKRHSKKRKSISKDSRSHTVSHFFFSCTTISFVLFLWLPLTSIPLFSPPAHCSFLLGLFTPLALPLFTTQRRATCT